MLEYLMGYVDKLEELIGETLNTTDHIGNDIRKEIDVRYLTLIEMKKFILEDMILYFVDGDIRDLKSMKEPTRDLVHTTLKRWEDFCDKYPDYLDKQKIKDYMVKELIQED